MPSDSVTIPFDEIRIPLDNQIVPSGPLDRALRTTVSRVACLSRLGDDIEGDYSTLALVLDPDGNLVTPASPPSRPYPPA